MSEIYEVDDPTYMKNIKMFFSVLTYALFTWWLAPIRDYCLKQGWFMAATICNNVPNAITVLGRGLFGTFCAVKVVIAVYQVLPSQTLYFLIMVGVFASDFIDGHLARQLNYVSKFGAYMDPCLDKLVTLVLAVGLVIVTVHHQNLAYGILLGIILAVVVAVDMNIAGVTGKALRYSTLTGVDLHGAFGPGKTKFTLQGFALAFGYGFMIWGGHNLIGTFVAIPILIASRHFGIQSLERHTNELHMQERIYLAQQPVRASRPWPTRAQRQLAFAQGRRFARRQITQRQPTITAKHVAYGGGAVGFVFVTARTKLRLDRHLRRQGHSSILSFIRSLFDANGVFVN